MPEPQPLFSEEHLRAQARVAETLAAFDDQLVFFTEALADFREHAGERDLDFKIRNDWYDLCRKCDDLHGARGWLAAEERRMGL